MKNCNVLNILCHASKQITFSEERKFKLNGLKYDNVVGKFYENSATISEHIANN